jgi:cellobiose phosphorylase
MLLQKKNEAAVGSGWDGKRFRSALDFFGIPVGSHDNDEGKIFIEPQGLLHLGGMGLQDGKLNRLWIRCAISGYTGWNFAAASGFFRLSTSSGEIFLILRCIMKCECLLPYTVVMIAETILAGSSGAGLYLRINRRPRGRGDIYKCEPMFTPNISGRMRSSRRSKKIPG